MAGIWMRIVRTAAGTAILLVVSLACLEAPIAAGAETRTVTFDGTPIAGSITVTANDDYTEATIESLSATYTGCGEEYETSCTWSIRVGLGSEPARRCDPSTQGSQTIWDSGEQTESGTVSAGPLSFPLEGCPGQNLAVSYQEHHTLDPPPSGPLRIIGHGGGATLALIAFGPEASPTANPPAQPTPPFASNQPPKPEMTFGAGCRDLAIGPAHYSFAFSRLDCRTAKRLARTTYVSRVAPPGYRCHALVAEGHYCWRRGDPAKHLAWRLIT